MDRLPEDYQSQMKAGLGGEYPAFLKTYQHSPHRGLRINTLKLSREEAMKLLPFTLEPIPWCPTGFFYPHGLDRPGKHVFHAAGLYYIQDPSAMAPVEALDPQPGEAVLDLCAAPGGKTTQIAAKMDGAGLLVANEIMAPRRKVLVENLERCGVVHSIVLGERPDRLAARFAGFFDRILIDAPCSGEGMFRKDPETAERWSLKATEQCAVLQGDILESAAPMLKSGGVLVYSTCTFNPRENEQVIDRFIRDHPSFSLETVPGHEYYQPGRPDWADTNQALSVTSRLWPHHLKGEGHFVARLRKAPGPEGRRQRPGKFPPVHGEAMKQFKGFVQENLKDDPTEKPFTLFGEHLYQTHKNIPPLKGMVVERAGLHLGQSKRSHFVPSHAWAMTLDPAIVKRSVSFDPKDPDLHRYMMGEAIPSDLPKGWTLVMVDRFPLGWGKVSGGLLKNHLPKWLRWDAHFMDESGSSDT
ncbi:RsmB/NOP family class I SAM-dependent RNA methyltransferase [Desmospora profundinema]|uniref:NOL1/NOP2/sun family putative RNA methylase n=1 Tax=Desmospora profundinema TaxID=1571184 RepID=A0ABU1IP04_9BACL|nr:RsmB/NOP family class I SAM-dependent RNA methyltransferase [Desmospora profundinema]MDR6226516.1 NOL1/NOP2/sun family putative RNA methylase [Desmospora profundinema]